MDDVEPAIRSLQVRLVPVRAHAYIVFAGVLLMTIAGAKFVSGSMEIETDKIIGAGAVF